MIPTSELLTEDEIRAKGKDAPRITPEKIDAVIAGVFYFTADQAVATSGDNAPPAFNSLEHTALKCLTICVIVLRNGFTVIGESACASPENFDRDIGRSIAYKNAREKIWPLEGYLLRSQLAG